MFTRCLLCRTPFPPNEALEHFPLGERVAYDPVRGRLWAVCRSCRRWSLAPIEERWEALEELEKLVTDRARLLSSTENVSLMRADGLEVVRVGGARMDEEAWWRYGRELTGRRRSFRKVSFVGSVAVGGAILGGMATSGIGLVGAWFLWDTVPGKVNDAARWLRYGGAAWRGDERCRRCGHRFRSLRFRDRSRFLLVPDGGAGGAGGAAGAVGAGRAAGAGRADASGRAGDAHPTGGFDGADGGGPGIVVRCPRCRALGDGGLHLTGRAAERTVRRVLAYHHYSGASERRVVSATRLIREAGSPEDLTRTLLADGRRVGDLQRTGAIALEIAANDTVERRLLEMELAELEARWKEEEELAAIMDGELTPLPLLEDLRRRVTGRGGG